MSGNFVKLYLVQHCIERRRFPPFHLGSCTWAHDCMFDTVHSHHMYQGKDQHTCFLDKPYFEDNPHLVRILVDNQHKDHPDTLVDKCRFHHCNVRWRHKAIMHMDQQQLVLLQEEQTCCKYLQIIHKHEI